MNKSEAIGGRARREESEARRRKRERTSSKPTTYILLFPFLFLISDYILRKRKTT